jgi:hypothetical protein
VPEPTTPADEIQAAAGRLRSGMLVVRIDLNMPLADWLDAEVARLTTTAHPDWHDLLAPHALRIARLINRSAATELESNDGYPLDGGSE